MITMRIKGGLGNQLFQYAAAFALSKRLEQPFQFDFALSKRMTPQKYRLTQLNVVNDTIVDANELPAKINFIKNAYVNKAMRVLNFPKHRCGDYLYWLETRYEYQKDFFTIKADNLYVDGYFQSEEYFKEYRADLLRQFQPAYPGEPEYLTALSNILSCNSVAVHVRRGDFQKDKLSYHYLLEEGYYRRAIAYMREHLERPVFFWFSNDFDWVREHFGKEPDFQFVRIKTAYGDIDDMMLMKNCNHIITANSTFSWWAAWLNEHKNVIRVVPEKAYGMDGMIPDGWVKITVG